jgi:hypothetical protein
VKKSLNAFLSFVRRHKLFSFFFITTLSINIVLLTHITRQATDFLSYSSFDRGPLGSYGIYTYMEEKKIPISRMMLAPFRNLDPKKDSGKTLIIISPRYVPGPWEWKQILEWVNAGNRLITTGLFLPTRFMEFSGNARPVSRVMTNKPVSVALPLDTLFPYKTTLPFPPTLTEIFFNLGMRVDTSAKMTVALSCLQPGMLPLLICDTSVLAAKQKVGKGEWILFAYAQAFSNAVLKQKPWFEFACRLLTGDGSYAARNIFFDEYHNGYRATKSFWEMLKYYEFDTAILIGAALILLYLFFTGIRILPPVERSPAVSRDILPGLRSMANLFFRFQAFEALIRRELTLLKRHLLAADGTADARALVQAYVSRAPLPPPFTTTSDLEALLLRADKEFSTLVRSEITTVFNTITYMRKELSL